ncbi:truncated hemoglobin YjbI [Brevundimonas sp. 1080]
MQTRFRIDDPAGAAARREAAVQRLRDETGIDEAMIDALVEGFYARVRDDALIGPIFADRITDWAPHLAQMKLF